MVGHVMTVSSTGTVSYRRRLKVCLTQSFNAGLVHFPFDHHGLDVLLESYGYGADDVFLIPLLNKSSPHTHNHERRPIRRDLRNTALASETGSWDIYSFDMYTEVRPSINFKRDNYYIGRMYIGRKFFMPFLEIVFPLILTVLLSFSALLFRLHNIDVRSNMVAVGVFSSLMYIYVVKEDLPPISFLTWTHYYLIVCLFFIGAATVEVIICHYLDPSGEAADQAADEEMDRLAGNGRHLGSGKKTPEMDPRGWMKDKILGLFKKEKEDEDQTEEDPADPVVSSNTPMGAADKDGDGMMSLEEAIAAGYTEKEFKDLDVNGDGQVSKNELAAVDTDHSAAHLVDEHTVREVYDDVLLGTHHLGAKAHTITGKRMLVTFDFIDKDNSGDIDADELRLAIEAMNALSSERFKKTLNLTKSEAIAVIMKTKEHFAKINDEVLKKEFGAGHEEKAAGGGGGSPRGQTLNYDEFVWAVEHEVAGLQHLAHMRNAGKKCCWMNETHVPAFDRICQVILPLLFFIVLAVMVCAEVPNITYQGPKDLDILMRKDNFSPEYKGLITKR
jgi:Ca2+-binding EF-hand superfamily protein